MTDDPGLSPTILVVETSSPKGSVGLLAAGEFTTVELTEREKHSETLLPAIETLLTNANSTFDDLTALAFGIGPGSFTGLRIAASVVSAIAFAKGLPIVGIGTLEATAQAASTICSDDDFLVVADARMGDIFLAAYRKGTGGWSVEIAPELTRLDRLPDLPDGRWRLVGPPELGGRIAAHYGLSIPVEAAADAQSIVELALPRLAAGDTLSPEDAQPLYLRNKVAKTMAEQKAS